MFKKILGGRGGERVNPFSDALNALESDTLAFQKAKDQAMKAGPTAEFVLNGERLQVKYDGQTSQTVSLGPANQQPV